MSRRWIVVSILATALLGGMAVAGVADPWRSLTAMLPSDGQVGGRVVAGQVQGPGNPGGGAPAQGPDEPPAPQGPPPLPPNVHRVCPDPGPDRARCHSQRRSDVQGPPPARGRPTAPSPAATAATGPWAPTDLVAAYNPPPLAPAPAGTETAWTWNNQTVAIVDAYHDPYAETELQAYRQQFGLPPCTTANGCFTQVDQNGGPAYPVPDSGWAQEIALDIQMVSAICPMCKMLLVEANSNSYANLGAAVATAARLGANAISNSYGGGEWRFETSYEAPFNQPGRAVTVSSGDYGYGVSFPAASRYVTAVGGTSLTRDSTGAWNETAWSGAGSGCSQYIPKPDWQRDTGCSRRTVADVAAVADPNTGVWVFSQFAGGWTVFGGTSVSAPIIASVYALAGNTSQINAGSYPYSRATALFDVTSGSNGRCARQVYLCTSVRGYDGPTGLGTPRGTGGF